MAKDIYDLSVRVQNERSRLRSNGNHPADINALAKGVFTGLNLGIVQMQAKGRENEIILAFLADCSNNLVTNLERANLYMPEGKQFKEEMFVSLSYRTSGSRDFYERGIRWGFNYVIFLFEAFLDPSSEVVARRMTVDHVRAVVKMLEQL